MTLIKNFLRGEEGISAVEYALLLAFIAAGVAATMTLLGGAVSSRINAAATSVSTGS